MLWARVVRGISSRASRVTPRWASFSASAGWPNGSASGDHSLARPHQLQVGQADRRDWRPACGRPARSRRQTTSARESTILAPFSAYCASVKPAASPAPRLDVDFQPGLDQAGHQGRHEGDAAFAGKSFFADGDDHGQWWFGDQVGRRSRRKCRRRENRNCVRWPAAENPGRRAGNRQNRTFRPATMGPPPRDRCRPAGWLTARPARYNKATHASHRSRAQAIVGVRDNVDLRGPGFEKADGGLGGGKRWRGRPSARRSPAFAGSSPAKRRSAGGSDAPLVGRPVRMTVHLRIEIS